MVPRFRRLKSVPANFMVQSDAIYAQHSGRLALIPIAFLEYLGNVVALQSREASIGRRHDGASDRQVLRPDQRFAPDNHGTLDDVLELTDVAGPVITREPVERRSLKPL